jgi:hypothetical protein
MVITVTNKNFTVSGKPYLPEYEMFPLHCLLLVGKRLYGTGLTLCAIVRLASILQMS